MVTWVKCLGLPSCLILSKITVYVSVSAMLESVNEMFAEIGCWCCDGFRRRQSFTTKWQECRRFVSRGCQRRRPTSARVAPAGLPPGTVTGQWWDRTGPGHCYRSVVGQDWPRALLQVSGGTGLGPGTATGQWWDRTGPGHCYRSVVGQDWPWALLQVSGGTGLAPGTVAYHWC